MDQKYDLPIILNSVNTTTEYEGDFLSTRYIDVVQVKGSFVSGTTLKGNTSNAIWTMDEAADDMVPLDNAFEEINDNYGIETESDSIIDFTEVNPFGEP